jgi:hypothetical protein
MTQARAQHLGKTDFIRHLDVSYKRYAITLAADYY